MRWNVIDKKQRNKDAKFQREEIIKILLENRGLKSKKEVNEFLNPTRPEKFSAKDLEIDEKEVKKAVSRINKAIKNNEAIVVYGDYDADGICATAILWETLYQLTKNVLPYIPERISEGYGLNTESIKNLKFKTKNLKLIITVDHGITAADKIKYAEKLGIDVIVCDHHQVGKEKPECTAVVHTEKICATAIAWFLSMSLRRALPRSNPQRDEIASSRSSSELAMTDYLDLVAIATIADLEPLVGINRSFAKYGLEVLRKTERCGLLAIFEEAGIKKEEIDTYHVGYIIAPRLNAMGRMEHALESLRLLCTKDCVKAKSLAEKLGLTNKERQLLTEETAKQAKLLVAGLEGELPKFLVVDSDQYEEGIIGLVAGKLVEEFHRPALVISRGEVYSKASARSITGFNIIEAIRLQSDLLVDAGGHPMAAGLTIETTKIEILKERLLKLAEEKIPPEALEKVLKIDMEIPLSEVNSELWEEIQKMAPFGLGNYEPIFISKAVVRDFRTVGNEGKHLKLIIRNQESGISEQSNTVSAIAFSQGKLAESLKIDQEINVAYNIVLNEWNGEKKVELKVKDIKWTS